MAAAIMRLPAFAMRKLTAAPIVVGDCRLETQAQFLLELQARSGRPGFGELGVQETRAAFGGMRNGLGPRPRPVARVIDRLIPGLGVEIPVRIYSPVANPDGAPALVYYHGGGWVIGDLDSHDDVCRSLAVGAECVVVSVDYRLAPESRFPAAVDDAIAAYGWVREHAAELGVDRARIAVGGDSAGGNLAAVVAQSEKREANPPCFQLLIYPVTDLRCESSSYEAFADGFFLTRAAMHWFRDLYLSVESERLDVRASPLLADDLTGLAPLFLATAGFDPLRDEGRAYAQRVADAGGEVAYRCYKGAIHGCLSLAGVLPEGRRLLLDGIGALRMIYSRLSP